MADYSLAQIVEWMKKEPRLFKWGMVSAVDRTQLNILLAQEYIRRFKTTSYLDPVSGSIPNGDDRRFALNGFTLDRPRLSFENVDLNDSKARLRMSVIGGTQLGLKNVGGNWYTREIRETSPLQGPELSLNLKLGDVPGVVGKEGELRLDLKYSDNFRMTVSDDQIEQGLVGAYFQQKFAALSDEQRVFPIGRVEKGDDPLLQAQSFVMRTQARRRTADDPEGAVLGFVRWEGDNEGTIPTPQSDFRYLIPNDGNRSATVLFDSRRVMLAQLLMSLNEVAKDVAFDVVRDAEGLIVGARATRGMMQVPRQDIKHRFTFKPEGGGEETPMVLDLTVDEITADMGGVLNVSFESSGSITLDWTIDGILGIKINDIDSEDGTFKKKLEGLKFDLTEFKKPVQDNFKYKLTCSYSLVDVAGGQLRNESFELVELKAPSPEFGEIKPPPGCKDNLLCWIIVVSWTWPIVLYCIGIAADMMRIINDLELPSVESLIRENLERDFQFAPSISALLLSTLKFNFGNTLGEGEIRSPRDVGFFGKINPQSTSFVIAPLELNMVAGATRQFTVAPATSNLTWSVEPIVAGVLSGQVGSIDPRTGVYTAPVASVFEGPFVRVRVNARNQASGFGSSALVTVLRDPLQVNPLLYVTQAAGSLSVEAGYLGDAGKLVWTLKDPSLGGTLAGKGLTAQYTAPAQMPPSDPDDPYDAGLAFIVEDVQVKDTASGALRTAVVIAESATKTPMLVTPEVDLATGTVKLVAFVNGRPRDSAKVEWAVRVGPGAFGSSGGKPNGVYTPGPSDDLAFAVLTATYRSEDDGVFEGYLVQPLPLGRLQEAVRATGVYALARVEDEVQP